MRPKQRCAARDWACGERGIARIVSVIAPATRARSASQRSSGRVPEQRVDLFDSSPADVWEHPA